jgi:hypothetical protein
VLPPRRAGGDFLPVQGPSMLPRSHARRAVSHVPCMLHDPPIQVFGVGVAEVPCHITRYMAKESHKTEQCVPVVFDPGAGVGALQFVPDRRRQAFPRPLTCTRPSALRSTSSSRSMISTTSSIQPTGRTTSTSTAGSSALKHAVQWAARDFTMTNDASKTPERVPSALRQGSPFVPPPSVRIHRRQGIGLSIPKKVDGAI